MASASDEILARKLQEEEQNHALRGGAPLGGIVCKSIATYVVRYRPRMVDIPICSLQSAPFIAFTSLAAPFGGQMGGSNVVLRNGVRIVHSDANIRPTGTFDPCDPDQFWVLPVRGELHLIHLLDEYAHSKHLLWHPFTFPFIERYTTIFVAHAMPHRFCIGNLGSQSAWQRLLRRKGIPCKQ